MRLMGHDQRCQNTITHTGTLTQFNTLNDLLERGSGTTSLPRDSKDMAKEICPMQAANRLPVTKPLHNDYAEHSARQGLPVNSLDLG